MDRDQGSNSCDFITGGFRGYVFLAAAIDLILHRREEMIVGGKRDRDKERCTEQGTVLGDVGGCCLLVESLFFSPLKG